MTTVGAAFGSGVAATYQAVKSAENRAPVTENECTVITSNVGSLLVVPAENRRKHN
jgi:hypothetical protein